jgi:hypothetical protein
MFSLDEIEAVVKLGIKRALGWRRDYRIPELSKGTFLFDVTEKPPRLNLVIPAIGAARAFGGVTTALRFFDSARKFFPRSRICVLGENVSQFEPTRWSDWSLDPNVDSNNTIAFLKDSDAPLILEPTDYFIATFWTTACFIKAVRDGMQKNFGIGLRPFVYLIQDFEPGFYAWSSRYVLAESTYANGAGIIAVFNTETLRDYFSLAGYVFSSSYAFEPTLNPKLALRRPSLMGHEKQRLIVVYGRPNTPRNAFELVVETLHAWSQKYDGAHHWQLISLGEKHEDIVFEKGIVLRSRGKVTIEEYANYLLNAAVGLALMVSPHPSYPPLEMAEFGVHVVTNQFANKDLSSRSPNIVSVIEASPDSLSKALTRCCEQYEMGTRQIFGGAFLGEAMEFPFVEGLCEKLFQPEGEGPHTTQPAVL